MKSKSLFIALVMAFTMCVSAWAASVRVTGTHVRLRLNPSLNAAIYTDSYGTPIYPSKGQVLSWTGYNSNGFYEVSFHGRTLWIHSSYARPVNQATASIPENVLITGNKVLLRVGPGQNYAPLSYYGERVHLNKSDILKCVGVSGDWWRVAYGNGYYYVSRKYARRY